MPPETIPWGQIIGGSSLGGVLFVLWLMLKHIRENAQQQAAQDKDKNETIQKVSSDFSATVKQVSSDVNQGLAKLQETQTLLLADAREREARMHDTLRALSDKRA